MKELTPEERAEEVESLRRLQECWRTQPPTQPATKRMISYPCGCEYDYYDGTICNEDYEDIRLCKQHDSYVNEKEER